MAYGLHRMRRGSSQLTFRNKNNTKMSVTIGNSVVAVDTKSPSSCHDQQMCGVCGIPSGK